jgi:pimeloyl-ACP methyl ester carboxylesterase
MVATDICFEGVGSGEPTLLFVHGFCCDGTDWLPLIDRLSDRYRCVALDLPGHGKSSGSDVRMRSAGAAVNSVKDQLSAENVILVGHSLGTKIIRETYRQDPQSVVGLVLVDGSLYVSDREIMLSNARAALANGTESFLRDLFGRMFDDDTDLERKRFLLDRALSMNHEVAPELFLDPVDWDTRSARSTLECLEVPAMVIQAATFDATFRWRQLREGESTALIDAMRTAVPDFEAVVVPGPGHFVMTDQPDLAAAAIDRFAVHARTVARGP